MTAQQTPPPHTHFWFCCQRANGYVLALKVLIITYSQSCLLLQWQMQGRGPDDGPTNPPPTHTLLVLLPTSQWLCAGTKGIDYYLLSILSIVTVADAGEGPR